MKEAELTPRSKVLAKIIPLVTEPLPEDFMSWELNKRIWAAFEIGKEWQKLEEQDDAL